MEFPTQNVMFFKSKKRKFSSLDSLGLLGSRFKCSSAKHCMILLFITLLFAKCQRFKRTNNCCWYDNMNGICEGEKGVFHAVQMWCQGEGYRSVSVKNEVDNWCNGKPLSKGKKKGKKRVGKRFLASYWGLTYVFV